MGTRVVLLVERCVHRNFRQGRRRKILLCYSEFKPWEWKLYACFVELGTDPRLYLSARWSWHRKSIHQFLNHLTERSWQSHFGWSCICRLALAREAKLKEQIQVALLEFIQSSSKVQRWYHHLKSKVCDSAMYLWHTIKEYREIILHKY